MGNQQAAYSVYVSFSEDRAYIGSKKNITPNYFGSFRDSTFAPTDRMILDTTDSYEDALILESFLQKMLRAVEDDFFVNQNNWKKLPLQCQNSLTRSISRKNWIKNNPEKLKESIEKTTKTRKEKGSFNIDDSQKELLSIANKKNAVETGRQTNGRVISQKTYDDFCEYLKDKGIDFNPIDREKLMTLESFIDPNYGKIRKLKSKISKIKTGKNNRNRILSEKEIEKEIRSLNDYLVREYNQVVGNVERLKHADVKTLLSAAEDIVYSLSKGRAVHKRTGKD